MNRWETYRRLKELYTRDAKNTVEYEAACRRAAREAGV